MCSSAPALIVTLFGPPVRACAEEERAAALSSKVTRTRETAARAFADLLKWTIQRLPGAGDGRVGMEVEATLEVGGGRASSTRRGQASGGGGADATLIRRLQKVFGRLTAAVRHPSPEARLGGCLVWSFLYRTFREVEQLGK